MARRLLNPGGRRLTASLFSGLTLTLLAGSPALAQPNAALDADGEGAGPGEAFLLTGEALGGVLLGKPQSSLFGPGGSLAAGVYRSMNPYLLLGLRLRGAAFLNRSADDATRADPGMGGLGSLSLAARVRPLARGAAATRAEGLWIEGAGGGGLTGKLFRPVAEAGLGWGFPVGPVVIGPAARYLHVFQSGSGPDGTDGKAIMLGVELVLRDPQPLPPAPPPPPPRPPAPAPKDTDGDGILDPDDKCPTEPEDKDGFEDEDGCPDNDNDKDGIADKDDACPNEAEVVNGVDDKDGCPDEGLISLVDDRVVLEERLLFDTDRARVSSQGRRALQAVVQMWKQHPEWERMEVEGHADVRGTDKYNQWLSEERAKRVMAVLTQLGIPATQLTAVGFGKTRPRAEGRAPEALQQNRRVELVVIRKRPADPTGAPAAPTQPAPASEGTAPAAPVAPTAPAKSETE